MDEQRLLEVDARVAKLRDQIAAGKATPDVQREIDDLVDQRIALTTSKMGRQLEGNPSA